MGGETGEVESGWTVDTLRLHVERQFADMRAAQAEKLNDLRIMLDERYATQVKAVDAAFLAQQTAMQTALTAAERAVQTALLSAEKAVGKAEISADKRFESVNEFRSQLADQATRFIIRTEADARFRGLDDKVEALQRVASTHASVTELGSAIERIEITIKPLVEYVNRNQGTRQGIQTVWLILVAIATISLGAIGLAITLTGR